MACAGGGGGRGCPCLGNSPCSIIPMETSGWSMPRQPNLIFHFVFLFICFSTSNDQNVYTIPPQLNSWRSVTRNPDPGYRQPLHWCWVDKPACLIIRLFLEFATDSVFVKLKLNGNAVSCVRRQGKLWNAHIFWKLWPRPLRCATHGTRRWFLYYGWIHDFWVGLGGGRDPLNCQNQDRVSGYWVILRKCVLYVAMAKHFGVAVRWARWLSDTDDDDKVCLSQNWWWPLMSFFVLLCHLLPPGCRPTPGASKQTLHCSPQGWSTNCFLLHFRIKGCRNLQYISTFRGEPSFIRNCNSEACKWMNGVQTKRTNS